MERTYVSIDLKSFFASVECVERNLNPLKTNLVVADNSRTEKTICLAVTPSLKAYGIPGRARLFEVVQKVKEINFLRRQKVRSHKLIGKSYLDEELKKNDELEVDYIVASPQMGKYMKYSTDIYNVYLKYIAPEDIFPYSIDEVFFDITNYLQTYKTTAEQLVSKMIQDIYNKTGITATAGIGTNMYLCKIAMDIVAKHKEPNEIGIRIAQLDEMKYRRELWNHRPLTDFWRVGKGYAEKLEKNKLYTMGDIARCSIDNEELLYKLFGINAELLIDHAWGWEPCTIDEVKAYRPANNSISNGQVLHCPYNSSQAELIIQEMAELMSLDLAKKKVVTNQLVLTIGYDVDNLINQDIAQEYHGEVTIDRYGRRIPKHGHGTINLNAKTSSTTTITKAFIKLYNDIVNKTLLIRRVNLTANNLTEETNTQNTKEFVQMDIFTDYKELEKQKAEEERKSKEEKLLQKAIIDIKEKFGKNAIVKGMNLQEGGTTIQRNSQIGGHKE